MKNIIRRAKTIKKHLTPNFEESSNLIFKTLNENIIKVKTALMRPKLNQDEKKPTISTETKFYGQCLHERSQKFAKNHMQHSQTFFRDMSVKDEAKVLWIGCSDSRVDPAMILNNPFGSMMVQRNVANQVNLADANVLSVIEQAVILQNVEYIVVCGHTKCGGVHASCGNVDHLDSHLKDFLAPVHGLFHKIKDAVEESGEDIKEVMYRENIRMQMANLMEIECVKDAVEAGNLTLIPMLFNIEKGFLEEI